MALFEFSAEKRIAVPSRVDRKCFIARYTCSFQIKCKSDEENERNGFNAQRLLFCFWRIWVRLKSWALVSPGGLCGVERKMKLIAFTSLEGRR